MISNKGILYIEPSARTSRQPLIDDLTCKMTAAFRKGTKGSAWRGVHSCACGVHSSNCHYLLLNGEPTNSLCIHYLAYHRDEVPAAELDKVRQLDCGKEEPTAQELSTPGQKPEPRQPVMRGA